MIVPPLPASERADHRRSIPRLESTAVGRLGAKATKATQHKKRDELMGDDAAAADVDRQKEGRGGMVGGAENAWAAMMGIIWGLFSQQKGICFGRHVLARCRR